jgi:hypothetical protein
MLEPPAVAGAAWIVPGEAASIDPAVEAGPVIWTARLRTGRVVILRASVSRAFKAVALIVLVAAADSLVIVEAVVVDLAVIASAVEALVAAAIDLAAAAALAGSAAVAAGSGAGAEN